MRARQSDCSEGMVKFEHRLEKFLKLHTCKHDRSVMCTTRTCTTRRLCYPTKDRRRRLHRLLKHRRRRLRDTRSPECGLVWCLRSTRLYRGVFSTHDRTRLFFVLHLQSSTRTRFCVLHCCRGLAPSFTRHPPQCTNVGSFFFFCPRKEFLFQ